MMCENTMLENHFNRHSQILIQVVEDMIIWNFTKHVQNVLAGKCFIPVKNTVSDKAKFKVSIINFTVWNFLTKHFNFTMWIYWAKGLGARFCSFLQIVGNGKSVQTLGSH